MGELSLYPYQEQVFNLLAAGKNVILQAPTGAGKTRAALYPFFQSRIPNSPIYGKLPRKCIYSVPMRVLANQFIETFQKEDDVPKDITIAIQTGDQPNDRELTSDLIFATIDQTLSSFLLNPYSLSKRKANLNAAAVMGAYLVFDEFHLYDPISTLPTTLHMLQLLNGVTPFVLMTATFSQDMLKGLANALKAEVVPKDDAEREHFKALKSQKKVRRYHVVEQTLSAEAILGVHETRSVVICNTVDRARILFEELLQKSTGIELLLLHSRLLPEDRKGIEQQIRQRFAKDDTSGRSLIIVSTQAIEVGVDITSTRLHTELAPANAIIQRAGRCARYEGDQGDVFIYPYVTQEGETVDLCERVNPYKGQDEEFLITLAEFRALSGQVLDFAHEQRIITAAHNKADRNIISQLTSDHFTHRSRIFGVMSGSKRADVSHLIREVFQQNITISSNPNSLLDSPFDAPAFGIFPATLEKYVTEWLQRGDMLNIDAVHCLIDLATHPDFPADAYADNNVRYKWATARTVKDIHGARVLVVHPAVATYDPILGFLADRGGTWEAKLPIGEARSEGANYTYKLETYEQHIALVYQAAFGSQSTIWEEMEYAAQRLEKRYGWESGSLKRATEIAIFLHDVGKLSTGWQGWVREYQSKINLPIKLTQAYAHTDMHNAHHREIEQSVRGRPPHAVESAVACLGVLETLFADQLALGRAVYSAIARHHSPYAFDNRPFRFTQNARLHIAAAIPSAYQAVIDAISLPSSEIEAASEIAKDVILDLNSNPEREEIAAFQAYWLIVRVLRRADQLGTMLGAGHNGYQ
jgi:CRISPR-associated endonuclease/helicase Cas3